MSRHQRQPIDAGTVRDRLRRVTDPELDRSIVELDYVDELRIDDESVEVEFTLPTAWCSPAFAWMMAVDARDVLETHPAVSEATIRLHDHMHEAEINEGVNDRLAFEDVFDEADGDVEETRRTLDEKARLARQYRAVDALLEAGLKPEQIVRLTLEDVDVETDSGTSRDEDEDRAVVRVDDALSICVEAEPIRRYVEKATALDVVSASTDALFATPAGDPIPADEFETVHKRGRLAGTNMSGQGHVCENLGEARIGGPSAADD
ncbi:iron-sulfur cluster assembly protein [Halalkalicoccus ordinarius]|uniref:iron-sulfur cluster assembly protein n=1 Tax=Halalkalicoccus ordinarius TaxID=3116651 RepID=UPI00300F5C5F